MSQESPFYFPSKASRRPSLRTAALSVPSYPSSNPSRQPLLPNIAEDTQHYTNNSNRAFSDDDGKNQKRNPYQSTGGRSWDWAGSSKYQSKGYALSASTRSQRYWRAVKYFWPFVLSATLALAYMGLHFVLIPYKIQAAIDNGNALAQIDVLDIIQGPSGSSRNTLIVNGKGSTEVGEGPRAIPMTMHSAPLSISLSINGGSPKPLFQTRIPRIHIPRTGNVALIHGQEPLDILDIDLLREFLSKALTAIDTAPPVSYAMAMSSRPVFTSSWILGGSWKASYERTREFLLGGLSETNSTRDSAWASALKLTYTTSNLHKPEESEPYVGWEGKVSFTNPTPFHLTGFSNDSLSFSVSCLGSKILRVDLSSIFLSSRTEDLPMSFRTPKGSLTTALKCMGKYAEGSPMLLDFTDFEWKSAVDLPASQSSEPASTITTMQRLFKGLSFSRLMQTDNPESDNMVKLKWFVIISQVAYSWQEE